MKPMMSVGDEFFRMTPDEFAAINKAANAQGMMARIFELDGEAGSPDMRISFVLVQNDKDRKAS